MLHPRSVIGVESVIRPAKERDPTEYIYGEAIQGSRHGTQKEERAAVVTQGTKNGATKLTCDIGNFM